MFGNLLLSLARYSKTSPSRLRISSTGEYWTKQPRKFFASNSSTKLNGNCLDYRIRKHIPTNKLSITGSNIELDDIEFVIDNQEVVLNLTWLRDSCHCELCTHKHSRQRLFIAKDFRKDKFAIAEIKVTEQVVNDNLKPSRPANSASSKWLRVKWTDEHESLYALDWLKYVSSAYEGTQLVQDSNDRVKFHYPADDFYAPTSANDCQPRSWAVNDIEASLRPIEYGHLIDGFQFSDEATFINANEIKDMSTKRFGAMLSLTQQLVTYGLAKIVDVPRERNQVLMVAKSLAYERPTGYGVVFDVVVEPSEEINLAYSSLEFDIHSDLTYREMSPGVQLLHCIRNSTDGGLSYFSDTLKAAQELRESLPELFDVLSQLPATFVVRDPYRDMKFRKQQPIISLDVLGNISDVYYSPFMLPPIGFRQDIKLFYLALDKFTQLLQSRENKFISKMKSGDLFIFHNRRVLHGRSAYDPKTSSRFLQGCYMDWDEIKCLHEKLRSNKNN